MQAAITRGTRLNVHPNGLHNMPHIVNKIPNEHSKCVFVIDFDKQYYLSAHSPIDEFVPGTCGISNQKERSLLFPPL
jgi:hypothetical protein